MKRSFRKQNQEAEQKILKENADIYDDIVRQYYPPKQAPDKRRTLLKVGSAVFACLLIVSVLTVIVAKVFREEDHMYLLQNEVVEDLDVNELYKEFAWLKTDTEYTCRAARTYDSVSGDNLYFEARLISNDFAETIKIYLYANPYYKSRKKISGDYLDVKTNNINVKCKENVSVDSDSIYYFNYFAQFERDKTDIYIEYQQMWYEDDTHFFEFLKEITD